jgi:hypothetical protein
MLMRILVFLVIAGVAISCSSKVTKSGTSDSGKYSEDLSALRPKAPVDTVKQSGLNNGQTQASRNPTVYLEARHAVNQNLDAVLDSIDRINLSNGLVDGFTIQLYSGIQRDEALNVKKQIATAMPELDADLQFVQPNFRVRAGKYLNRLEAQKDFMAVKKLFPNAVIIPERIPIR